jgi:hypothetical protein
MGHVTDAEAPTVSSRRFGTGSRYSMRLVACFSSHPQSEWLTKKTASLGRRAFSNMELRLLTVNVVMGPDCPVSSCVLNACCAPSRLASTPQA